MSRKQFKMTPEQMERIRPLAAIGQASADRAWQELARELGFAWDTARPVSGEGMDVFTAEVPDASID